MVMVMLKMDCHSRQRLNFTLTCIFYNYVIRFLYKDSVCLSISVSRVVTFDTSYYTDMIWLSVRQSTVNASSNVKKIQ